MTICSRFMSSMGGHEPTPFYLAPQSICTQSYQCRSEHFPYPSGDDAGIYHAGIPKSFWCRLAAVLCDSLEEPDNRVAADLAARPDTHAMFPRQPRFRARIIIGSFCVEAAREQRVPSSDVVHYLLVHKVAVPAEGEEGSK